MPTVVPTYISANSFSCPGDVTVMVPANVVLDCAMGEDGIVTPMVLSSTYDSGTNETTVTTKTSVLTSNLSAVFLPYVSPQTLPYHTHSGAINWVLAGWSLGQNYNGVGLSTAIDALAHLGSSYLCILSHTAAANNEAGIGTDWQTYWQILADSGLDGASTPQVRAKAGEAINAFNVVATGTDGQLYKADNASGTYIEDILGIATGNIAQNASGGVQIVGIFVNEGWNWTMGLPIFLGTAGTMTQTPPTGAGAYLVQIGFPASPTSIAIKIGRPIKLAS